MKPAQHHGSKPRTREQKRTAALMRDVYTRAEPMTEEEREAAIRKAGGV